MAAIATVTGTAIRPGISKNNRLYTSEAIGRMVERAQARIGSSDDMPITMLTHHAADDDSTQLVGQLTRIWQETDGAARFEAVIDDTTHGRNIANLAAPSAPGLKPTLKGVSIRGAWLGKVRRENGPDGQVVEAGDDVELDGLDYTRKPGVAGAVIDSVDPVASEPRESDGTARVPITESAPEATVTITETAAAETGPYADLGYLGEPRLPVGTRTQAKASWLALCESTTARQYTAAQLKRVKDRAAKALRGHGVARTEEGWLVDPAAPVTEALAECWDMAPDRADVYLSLTNGPTTITVSSRLLDPHDLDAVGRAAMAGACTALVAIDPDMDADIDLAGAPAEDADDDMGETAPADALPQTPAPETPAAETPTQEKEPAMAESTPTPAAETPGSADGIHALGAKIDKLSDALAGFVTAMTPAPVAPVESAPTETVVEAAAPANAEVAETDEQRIARLVAEGIAGALPKAVQEHVEATGGPTRKGLVTPVTEHTAPVTGGGLPEGWPAKPLHEYTDEEFRQHVSPATVNAILGARA